MTPLISWLVIIVPTVGFISLIIWAATRSVGRTRSQLRLLDIHPHTKIFTMRSLNKNADVQSQGGGHEVFTGGVFAKPISIEPGWVKKTCNNVTLLMTKGFLEAINGHGGEFYKRWLDEKYTNTKLTSEMSALKAQLFMLQSQTKKVEDSRVSERVKDIKAMMPTLMMKKPSSGGGQSGFNRG